MIDNEDVWLENKARSLIRWVNLDSYIEHTPELVKEVKRCLKMTIEEYKAKEQGIKHRSPF
jgi:hypothetical protein